MNIVDIVLIFILIVALTIGYCRGFLASIIKIGAFICAIIATKLFHNDMIQLVKGVSFIRDFVDTGVKIIVEKFGYGSVVHLTPELINNNNIPLEGIEQTQFSEYLKAIQKFIGDSWIKGAENIGDAFGELLYSIIAYIVLLLGTFLVILIVGNIIIKIIHSSTILKGTDMILGAVFTGGISVVLMFITVKVITPFLLAVNNADFVSAVEGSRIIDFILKFLA